MSEDKRKKELESRILSGEVLDCELLEFIMYPACKEKSREVAERLMDLFKTIGKVINADLYELKSVAGMKDEAVARILSVKKIMDRTLKDELEESLIINSKDKQKLPKYLKATIGQSRKENLRAMYFDKNGHLIYEHQDCGTVSKITLYIREIVKLGLLVEATSLIIAHNHPSQDLEPSEEDKENTLKLALACDNVGIELEDHIIVAGKRHFSFHDNFLL